jgi:aryl-phospho-beta-D-glucosidase BglC (GH1 family)
MISPGIDEAGLRTFGQEWNANVIRWQLIGWDPKGKPTGAAGLAAWDEWLQGELKKLDAALPLCRKYGLQVVVDLHSPPSGAGDPGPSMFNSPECQAKFIEAWQRMAR